VADFSRRIADDLASRLTESGLFAKEARAMVNTWNVSYFQTDGIRVLFVLPQSWTDAFIPMNVSPQPQQIVRVMVGRLELLSKEREQLAEKAIEGLAAPDTTRRTASFTYLRDQGRYVEPIVRRVLKTTKSEEVRQLCRRLLMTEFVTELRAAIHNAADGQKLVIPPTLLRAHLARLLRDIGLEREARTEAVAILHTLERSPANAGQAGSDIVGRLEIRAAALEASGVDRSAAAAYGARIEVFSNTLNQAEGMLGVMEPNTIAWCRDWWVGRAYGRCLVRAGKAEQTAADLEATLARQTAEVSPAARRLNRMLLAYVQEAQGKGKLADQSWAVLASTSPPASDISVVNQTTSP
jgi:hypothetical protein